MATELGQTELSRNPSAKYNKLSEKLRQVTPDELQCSIFCGGKKCKYENATCWDTKDMAIHGLYSNWITDEILACARPNTANIEKYDIIQQFQRNGIKSIFNLQSRGEHSSCTAQLHRSGFSYNPQVFMKENIFFYNFAIKDYGVASRDFLLDMVKVMAFALLEGKVAVHCHAGLGRTGVLIASYLIFSLRAKANEAIRYVRQKRANSIQTRGQMQCVQAFAQFILPNFITFAISDKMEDRFTLDEFLQRQGKILHGYEARLFKDIPKIVYVIGRRLLQLCHCENGKDLLIANGDETEVDRKSSLLKRNLSLQDITPTENRKSGIIRQLAMTSSPQASFDDGGSVNQITWPEADDPDLEAQVDTVSLSELNEDNVVLQNSCTVELNSLKLDTLKLKLEYDGVTCVMVTAEGIAAMFQSTLTKTANVYTEEFEKKLQRYQNDLNTHTVTWEILANENDPKILVTLLCCWFHQLKV
ncbi:hypothetical protein CHUAL_005194 [Chamberlinius hualienensis]